MEAGEKGREEGEEEEEGVEVVERPAPMKGWVWIKDFLSVIRTN